MASPFTHALVGAALGQGGSPGWRKDKFFWVLVTVCSVLPDIDVIGFRLGVRYGDLWGHRGMTHSLLVAALIAVCIAVTYGSALRDRSRVFLLFFLITASHGVLDALTNGGLGVAFFSPFNPYRYFFPWTPIQVSPISAGRFFSARGLRVLESEITWVWLPTLVISICLWVVRAFSARAASAADSPDTPHS